MTNTISTVRGLTMRTRDGVELASDVYLPDGDGPFPTLIYRVRGGRSSAFIAGVLLLNPFDAVERGFAVVIQEVRGRASSASDWHPFIHERNDSEDCLNWVLTQVWCDGRIGVYGTAYSAVGAMQMAALGREEVRAAVMLGTGADYHDGWIYTSGAFELGWNVYWVYMTLKESIARLDVSDSERASLLERHSEAIRRAPEMAARLPLRDHPLLLEVGDSQYHEWLDHPEYDDYWASFDLLKAADRLRAPTLSIIGWWDNFASSHFDLYRAIQERAPEPGRSHHRLIVGPWEHCNYVMSLSTNRTGEREFGTEAAAGVGVSGPLALDWFDRWLNDSGTGPANGVRYWQIGDDEWRDCPTWPPQHVDQCWYLGDSTDGGTLSTESPNKGELQFTYDPLDPTPTIGSKTLMPTIMRAGVFDRSSIADRSDVLIFDSGRLNSTVSVAGKIRVQLWASSSAPDTDFVAHLVDVDPEGYAMGLASGIVRARHREGSGGRAPNLVPGQPECFEIDLWDLAHTFKSGHQIRIEVASSDFPRFDRNLNVERDEPYGSTSATEAKTAEQTIYLGGECASMLVLPVTINE